MRILKIGLDFDGLIAAPDSLKAYYIQGLYGITVPYLEFKKEKIIEDGLVTVEEYHRIRDIVVSTNVGILADSIPDALIYILKLIREGHLLKVVTSRKKEGEEIVRRWLGIRGIDIEVVGVGSSDKSEAVKGLDVFFDNEVEKIKMLIGVVKNLYLFSNSFNRTGEDDDEMFKVLRSWKDFYEEIQILCRH